MHGLARGLDRIDEAEAAALTLATPDVIALVHDLRGILLFRAGRLDEAQTELDAAVVHLQHLEAFDRAALLLNRGCLRLLRHRLPEARDDLTRSAELAASEGFTRMEFKARHNAGYAEYLTGNLPGALAAFARADALDVDVSRSVWHLDRARVLMEAGLLSEAERSLAAATGLLTVERANQDRAEAQLARAELALLQGDAKAARGHATRARTDFRRRHSIGWASRADLTRWQAELDSPGGAARVARDLARLSALDEGVSGAGDLALVAAEAQLALGHVEAARALVDGRGTRRTHDPLSSQLRTHLVRAGVARAAADPRSARRELRTGLTALTREQARHPSLDLRTAMAVHGARLAELDLRLALESGEPASVFDSLERWRALSHRRTAVTPPSDPELAELLTQLRLASEDLRATPAGPALERTRRRQHQLQQAVREREWRLEGDGQARREVRMRELRPLLAAHETDLASYFVLDERLVVVGVSGGRVSVTTLAPWSEVESLVTRVRADLDALAGRLLPPPLRAAITSSLARDLDRLDTLLLPPALAGSARLVVVPSRSLPTLPWGLLPRRRRLATTVSLSATAWAGGLLLDPGADSTPHGPRVVAVAGPGLLLAEREVADVTQIWTSRGQAATAVDTRDAGATSLAAALGAHDLVHIAAHGTHNHDNPLFSSIRLSGGPLFAYDVPQDARLAGHVVLSACDLGMATPRPGGEVLGLTAALLGMGVRCVVSSVARIDDAVAHATMVRYHAGLATGLDAAAALAAAVTPDADDADDADDGEARGGREGSDRRGSSGRRTGSTEEDDIAHPAPFVCFGSPWSASSARPDA